MKKLSNGSCVIDNNATAYKALDRLELFNSDDGGSACGYVV
jgi:hypothetical protein